AERPNLAGGNVGKGEPPTRYPPGDVEVSDEVPNGERRGTWRCRNPDVVGDITVVFQLGRERPGRPRCHPPDPGLTRSVEVVDVVAGDGSSASASDPTVGLQRRDLEWCGHDRAGYVDHFGSGHDAHAGGIATERRVRCRDGLLHDIWRAERTGGVGDRGREVLAAVGGILGIGAAFEDLDLGVRSKAGAVDGHLLPVKGSLRCDGDGTARRRRWRSGRERDWRKYCRARDVVHLGGTDNTYLGCTVDRAAETRNENEPPYRLLRREITRGRRGGRAEGSTAIALTRRPVVDGLTEADLDRRTEPCALDRHAVELNQ